MKKSIRMLLCAALILNLITGCGRETPAETTAPPTETTPQTVPETEPLFETVPQVRKYQGVELSYRSSLAETDPEAQVIIQAAEVFLMQTGAQVSIHWQGAGEADIFEVSGADLGADCLDLTEMAKAANYAGHSFACLRQQVTDRCGYLAGIPYRPYLTGVYYNTELFAQSGIDAAPATWEAFLAICQKLRDSGNLALSLNIEDAVPALELHLERNLGAAALQELVNKGAWAEQEQLLQQVIDFVKAGHLVKGTPAAFPAGQNKLGLSNVAMTVGTNAVCAQIEEAALAELHWGVFPWPGSGAGSGTFVTADVLAVHRNSENPQAAFDFIMLLTTGEFDQLRADIAGGIPADPGNESLIAGAVEAMLAASPNSGGLLGGERSELYLGLWDGSFKTAEAFAESWGVG